MNHRRSTDISTVTVFDSHESKTPITTQIIERFNILIIGIIINDLLSF